MILASVNRPLTPRQRPLSLTVLNLFLVNSVGPNAALMRLRSRVQYQCGLITDKSTVSASQLVLLNQASHFCRVPGLDTQGTRWESRDKSEQISHHTGTCTRCPAVGRSVAGFWRQAIGAHFSIGTTAVSNWHLIHPAPSCRKAAKLPSPRTYYSNLENRVWGGGGVSGALVGLFAVTMDA